jgi:hypothetical protein
MSADDSDEPNLDETRPLPGPGAGVSVAVVVTAATPSTGEASVPAGVQPTVTFSSPLDPSTVTGTTLRLVRQGTAVPVAAQVVYDPETRSATIAPTAPLEAGASYVVTVAGSSQGIRDVHGGALAVDVVWGFTVAERRGGRGTLIALLAVGLLVVAGVLVWALAFRDGGGIESAPAAVDFGDQDVGKRSAAQTVTVTNGGDSAVITAIAIQGKNAGDFAVGNASTCAPGPLDAGAACTISVRFTPAEKGDRAGSLEVEFESGEPAAVALTGTGVGEAVVSVSTNRIDFGPVEIGSDPVTEALKVTNSGPAPLTLTSLGIEGEQAADFAVSSEATTCSTEKPLAPAASCEIAVAFAPEAVGESSATLVIQHEGTGGSSEVALVGQGEGQVEASLEPDTVDFGDVGIGSASEPEPLTVSNTGTADLPLATIAIEGSNARDFEVQPDGSCRSGATLAAGDECTVAVAFVPTAEGERAGTLTVAGSSVTLRADLAGTGTAAPAATG